MEYDARQKAILDYNQMVLEATENGLQKGMEQGLAEGLKQGLKQGKHKKAIQIAKSMLLKNFTPDIISEITGLSLNEIHSLNA